jgi:alkylresorcinol/alkylpyrone synthase
MAFIFDCKTSFPSYEYSQEELIDYMGTHFSEHQGAVKKIFKNALVERRHLSSSLADFNTLSGFEARNQIYQKVAIDLATKNLDYLFNEKKFPIGDVGLIISTTITGLMVPSIEARLMNRFQFHPSVKRLPIFGLGCLAGVATIARAQDYLKSHPKQAVLVVATELCSLTLQWNDVSMSNLVGCSLFADGSGAVIIVGDEHPLKASAKLEIIDTVSSFFPDTERIMGWDIVDEGFRLVLSGDVPLIVKEQLAPAIKQFLDAKKLNMQAIKFVVSHPGGPKVLYAMEESLGIKREMLELSYESLKENGNMSSVSVLNVLEKTLNKSKIGSKGDYGLMLAMGPAFCSESILVRLV